MDRKAEILEKITKDGFPEKEVAVTVEDFFEGNNDNWSIGPNIYPDTPSLQTFYDTLKSLKSSDKIEDVFIRITDADSNEWFYTDAVYIIGNVSREELKELLRELQPDEIYDGWMYGLPVNLNDFKTGKNVFSVWWD